MSTAKNIRTDLKAKGINSRQVSVVSRRYSSICVEIKDITIPFKLVNEIAHKYEVIHRCDYTGEILSGGNIYVTVRYAWEVERDTKQTEEFQNFFKQVEGKAKGITGSEGFEVVPGVVAFKSQDSHGYKVTDKSADSVWTSFYDLESTVWAVFTKIKSGVLAHA